ncbi:lysine transporter LysE [Actinobacillus succinogenes]|uniref:Lysine exporter protein (LYSE/YGGA) n=1 Tax=Actinobacillus succinogenes (strain ATCC 55618 / DSM 22257 / CCUG 43843 / 130Z) TaxID=339671 RepID=A6VNY2_ACTSZ|nr:LysE family transporter [Actinobacillus succinogenes]ABR74679.1 Lysine exporter protein (LYSE/YGGA) [Actinobacillus succinogenes 130Z]PHI40899.1 lysine transporter LysE [Actinobacillus succinogenes]
MTEFFAVAMITILAVISPGADFAIVTKNSYLYGRAVGFLTSIGIALGVLVHVAYTLIGVAVILKFFPNFLNIIKYLGAFYLIYIGYKTATQKPVLQDGESVPISRGQALRFGFFTNALNPKTTLFVVSTFTQIVSASTHAGVLLGYGAFMSLAHFIWFALVAWLFSAPLLRTRMLKNQRIINRIIGVILALLGVFLLMSNIG